MTKHATPSIEQILTTFPDDQERELVRRAYEFAERVHAGELRKDKVSPYITHSLAVAGLLTELRMDAETIAAGLLHDVLEDDHGIHTTDLEQAFGTTIAHLVDGVTKLDEIKRIGRVAEVERDERELETLRKMLLATARDARVMLVKLADRLHNMRTLEHLTPDRQARMARETIEIYAPLANRLGIWRWRGELQDLTLRYLEPVIYHEIADRLAAHRDEREADVRRHIALLDGALRLEGIDANVTGRPKHIYSIYHKMTRKQVPLEQVYDVRAIRVIVDTIPDCYQTLGVVHRLWTPVQGEFDDYIATPKLNMYQALHTAVVGMDGKNLEVQIRTHYMNRIAEYGIAAHWRYKEGRRRDYQFEENLAALRAQIEARSGEGDAEEFVEGVTGDLFQERVYVFTPKGKIIDLPAGATPIDFAYHVHTEIGDRCRGAKVNGIWVPLDHPLQTGDRVQIVTAKRGGPSRDWLNPALGYVKSARARSKIRRWFRQLDREQNIALGRTILERELKRLGLASMAHEDVAVLFEYEETEDLLARIGFGDINSQQIASRVLAEARRQEEEAERESEEAPSAPIPSDSAAQVHVMGSNGLMTRLARCCNPILGDPVIGYITRGRGVTIHQRDCPNVINARDTERLIEVDWGPQPRTFPVLIQVEAFDRAGLVHDISGIISKEKINISSLNTKRRQNWVTLHLLLDVTDTTQVGWLLARLANVPNVVDVRRITK